MKKLTNLSLVLAGLVCMNEAKAQTEVTFYTNMGIIKAELTDALTPITADSFITRVANKFYDKLTFHRVIDGFMIQGGDPNGNGTGGPGYKIPDEFHPSLQNVPKSLSMANAGPNTGGSQFFINLVNNSFLNNRHAVFGMVTEGFEIVEAIAKVPKNRADKPDKDVVMDSVRVTKMAPGGMLDGKELVISPNPSNGVFTVTIPGKKTQVEVVSSAGKVVFSKKAKGKVKIDISNERKGIYQVKVKGKEGDAVAKIVTQ